MRLTNSFTLMAAFLLAALVSVQANAAIYLEEFINGSLVASAHGLGSTLTLNGIGGNVTASTITLNGTTNPATIDIDGSIFTSGQSTVKIIASETYLPTTGNYTYVTSDLTGHSVFGTASVTGAGYLSSSNYALDTPSNSKAGPISGFNGPSISGPAVRTSHSHYSITEVLTLLTGNHPSETSFDFSSSASAVPEPASLAIWGLLGTACIGFGMMRHRKLSVMIPAAQRCKWTSEQRDAINRIVLSSR